MFVAIFAAGGATCPTRRQPNVLPPAAFTEMPTQEQVIATVNASTASVRNVQASRAEVSTPGLPSLRANLVVERPRRFRLRAEATALTGAELDLGSNEDVFWMWVRRNRPPAVYYARHDQFQRSAAREVMPIEPEWLIEALGLVYIDPNQPHEGPIPRPDGNIEIRSRVPSADGEVAKVIVIDKLYGWVLEQHMFDTRGQLVASVRASKHRYYPAERVSLPGKIEVRLAATQMSFTIEIGGYVINQLAGDPAQLWSVPQIEGYPLVDVADPSFQPSGPEASDSADPATPSRYRGYEPGR